MDKDLKRYYQEMAATIESTPETDRAALLPYHAERVAEFQHERLIHLIVTFFFGFLVLVFAAAFFWLMTFGVFALTCLAGLLVGIVLVTELFYVRHYYLLENGVQKLYTLTEKLQ